MSIKVPRYHISALTLFIISNHLRGCTKELVKKKWAGIEYFEIRTNNITKQSCQLLLILLISGTINGCLKIHNF